jgi:hypothetical protein
MDRDEKPHGEETSVFISSGSANSSSYPWVPEQTMQSGNSFQQAFAHDSEKELPGSSITDPVLKTYSEGGAKSPLASPQVDAALPAVLGSEIAFAATAVTPVDQERAYPEQSLNGQENVLRTKKESLDSSTAGVNVHAVQATPDAPSHVPAARSVVDNAAPAITAAPAKPLTPAATQIAPADGKPVAQAVSSTRTDNPPSVAVPVVAEVFVLQEGLPIAPAPADNGSGSQPLANPGKKEASSAAGSGNPAPAITADGATSKSTNATSGPGDALPHSAQNTAQPSPDSQADASRATEAAPKAADASPSQAQTVAVQAGIAGTTTQHPTAAVADVAPRPTGQQEVPASVHAEGGEAVAASSINSAKLMQTMSETEMHVGMRSAEFGDISIRTSISQQQLVTQISLDHSDLSQAISAHVSTMQTKLGEDFGLHASIEVHNLGSSLSGEPGQSSQREQRAFTPSARIESALVAPEEQTGPNLGALVAAGNGNRLDIRA